MKLFEQLKKELAICPAGTYAPYYFRHLGMQDHLNDPITLLRAYGIHALFSKTRAHISPSDLIVGSTYGAYVEESEYVLAHAKQVVDSIGERTFIIIPSSTRKRNRVSSSRVSPTACRS